MTIDEIYKKDILSIRSYNACKYHELNTVQDLKKYLLKHKSFKKLRNCGWKSNEELINICNKYGEMYTETEEVELVEDPYKKLVSELSRIQREVINSFIVVNTNSLSVRSKNAILLYLNDNLKIKNFAEYILMDENFSVGTLKNVGKKCIPELEQYINLIRNFLIEVSESKDEKYLNTLKSNFLIQHTYSIDKIPSEILESQSIFQLTEFLINRYALFDITQTIILKKALKIFKKEQELTLDDIAIEVMLSRERVRQIRKICTDELFEKLSFIRNFNDDLFQKYNIDTGQNQIEIDEEIVDKINSINSTNLTRELITYVVYSYLFDRFRLIGNIEDVLQIKYFNSRNRHDWKNFYLATKEIVDGFDFNSLANDISKRCNDKIEESYSFNFKSYLSNFLISSDYEVLELVFPIAEKIVNEEFEMYLDLEEDITFTRNTYKQTFEYAYEALEHLGKPSKVNDIFKKVLEIYPNYETDEAKIRSSMKRVNGFIPFGRKSVFGLKKWECEFDNIKGGTIRSIVEEFLSNSDEPEHIREIVRYVLNFRPKSNQNSIWTNIKLDESGVFKFYKGSKIGLSNKNYSDSYILVSESEFPEKKSWEERFEMLINFTDKEGRMPYSSGCSESEISLYRWYNIQKRRIADGKLENEKQKLINEIDEKFAKVNGRRLAFSVVKYEELIDFVKIHSRLPSANKSGEGKLYQFFYNQRKLFEKDKLEIQEEKLFIEVAKELQKQ